MDTMTEVEQAQERALEVKLILRRLIDQVAAAEVEAADTSWVDEKTDLINNALHNVQWRCSKLAYDIGHAGETLLTKREAE